jgi:hypothetical protein
VRWWYVSALLCFAFAFCVSCPPNPSTPHHKHSPFFLFFPQVLQVRVETVEAVAPPSLFPVCSAIKVWASALWSLVAACSPLFGAQSKCCDAVVWWLATGAFAKGTSDPFYRASASGNAGTSGQVVLQWDVNECAINNGGCVSG